MSSVKKTMRRAVVLAAAGVVAYISLDENTKELVRRNAKTTIHTAQALAERLASMVAKDAAEPMNPKADILNQWERLGL